MFQVFPTNYLFNNLKAADIFKVRFDFVYDVIINVNAHSDAVYVCNA